MEQYLLKKFRAEQKNTYLGLDQAKSISTKMYSLLKKYILTAEVRKIKLIAEFLV